ncbi:MAG: hypothetical protein FWD61_06440 [Phycisphaerales bacterium]|nr:hypothetical protein [Phycisphaerales bacterium]
MRKRKSLIDIFNIVAAILLVWAANSLACNVPIEQYENDLYIYGVNTYVHYDGSGAIHNQSLAGVDRVSFPATVWIQAVINRDGIGFNYNPYVSCLQYKIKRPGDAAYGEWITVRTIIDPRWHVNFPDGDHSITNCFYGLAGSVVCHRRDSSVKACCCRLPVDLFGAFSIGSEFSVRVSSIPSFQQSPRSVRVR